jgi:hypothetical protein
MDESRSLPRTPIVDESQDPAVLCASVDRCLHRHLQENAAPPHCEITRAAGIFLLSAPRTRWALNHHTINKDLRGENSQLRPSEKLRGGPS